jgi:hypothetical protein
MDVLARFPRVWCPACNKTQPMIFDVMKAKDDDAAEIVCDEYKGRPPTGWAAKARAMAGQEIDRLSDPLATEEERRRRKRRLLRGPKEFRDVRSNRPKFK